MKDFILILIMLLSMSGQAAEFCSVENYKDYIYNSVKTNKLIEQTGAGCDFTKANMDRVNFFEADLRGAIFDDTNLHKVNFNSANLANASFKNANLFRVDLRKAQLVETDFRGAELYRVMIKAANFTRADLRDSLFYVRFGAFLSGKMRDAKYNKNSQFKSSMNGKLASKDFLNSLGMIEVE